MTPSQLTTGLVLLPGILLVLLPLSTVWAQETALPPYTLRDHPFATLPQFAAEATALTASAAVVKGYHRRHDRSPYRDVRGMQFVPRGASYVRFPSLRPFLAHADFLIGANTHVDSVYDEYFMRFEVHRPATIFVLLPVNNPQFATVRDMDFNKATVAAPDGWGSPFALRLDPNSSSFALSSEIVALNHKMKPRLPILAVAFEVPMGANLTVTLPAPATLKVNALSFTRYFVLFAQPKSTPPLPLPLPTAACHLHLKSCQRKAMLLNLITLIIFNRLPCTKPLNLVSVES